MQLEFLDALPQRHPNIQDHIGIFFRNDKSAAEAALSAMPTKKRLLMYELPQGPGDIAGS
jgi:hypothetical protein